jgi:hypothetical protein
MEVPLIVYHKKNEKLDWVSLFLYII